ncbi:MAG: TolC family protein [Acidobacteria bacterium]|nr:TolC family protein [Acidobacteriota bacterium]MBI3657008.1 TolC family protein [Acidobacteriota bacterium]
MQLTDPRVFSQYRRDEPSYANVGSAVLIFLILVNLAMAALHAQTPTTPKADTPAATPRVNVADLPKIETFVERAERKGATLRLSLKDAMKMALQNNLTIAIQDYSEEVLKSRIFGAAHVYEPRLVTGFNYRSDTSPVTSQFNAVEGESAFSRRGLTWFARTLQNLPYGGNYALEYSNSRSATAPTPNSSVFATSYIGNLSFTFVQPLLRDFRNNDKFRALKLVKLDDRINDTQFEEQVTAVVKQVQDLYWDLVYAIRLQGIRKKSLDLARVQLDNNRRKVEIGIMAPIAITEASAEEATRRQDIISSENQINNMQNNLKRALSKDRTSQIWNQDLIPLESPEVAPVKLDMDESITTAMQRRPELRRNQLKTEQVEVDYQFYKNQKRPRVDFTGFLGTNGAAGTPTGRSTPFRTISDPLYSGPIGTLDLSNCVPGIPCSVFPVRVPTIQIPNVGYPSSNFIGAVGALNRQLFSAPYRNYSVGVQLDIPLRNRPLEEQLAQLSLQRRQNLKQLKDTEQMVVVEVRNALQAIDTNRQVVETAKVGYRLAEEQLDAENKRFQAGLSTTFFVLQRQRDLADAEGRLLQAQINYQKSLNDLQKAKFTTIDQNDMEISKTQVPASERQR